MYIPTTYDKDILYQSNKVIYSKIEILNRNFKIIDSIEGNLLSDSYSIDANSDIRRSYSCTLHVSSASFNIGEHTNIWLDKYVRPYIGVVHQRSQEVVWYLMGTFCILNGSYSYNATEHNLSLECEDLMCTLNDTNGGQIEGQNFLLSAGEKAYPSLVGILKEVNIINFTIDNVDFEIPYDLEWAAGTPASQMLSDILELYSGFEMGFDINGSFFIRKIPQTFEEPYILDDTDIHPLLVSEQTTIPMSGIYNHVQVYGQSFDTDRYANTSSLTSGTYKITLEDVNNMSDIDNFEKIAFKINTTNPANAKISINGLESLIITDDNGSPIPSGTLIAGVDATFKYRRANKDFYYLGQYQVFGEAKDNNPDSPFKENRLGRRILLVLQGGEYEKIYSNDLAKQRAEYEIWKHTTLSSTLNLELVSIPWLDVNLKIYYTTKNKTEPEQYIIKNISGSTIKGTMSMECIKFYPEYIYTF